MGPAGLLIVGLKAAPTRVSVESVTAETVHSPARPSIRTWSPARKPSASQEPPSVRTSALVRIWTVGRTLIFSGSTTATGAAV